MKTKSVKITDEQASELSAYCEEHGLMISEAFRVALTRLFKKKPTAAERDAAHVERGTPENIIGVSRWNQD